MWMDEYVLRELDNRLMCEGCGERWHEENIDVCVNCQRDTCPRCAQIVSIRGRRRDEWWCNVCLRITGKTAADFVTEAEEANRSVRFVQATPQSLSVGNLKRSVLRDRESTFIEWSADEMRRGILRDSLKVLGFDVEEDGLDFEVAPGHLPVAFALLIFTEAGIQKLTVAVGEMIPYPEQPSVPWW